MTTNNLIILLIYSFARCTDRMRKERKHSDFAMNFWINLWNLYTLWILIRNLFDFIQYFKQIWYESKRLLQEYMSNIFLAFVLFLLLTFVCHLRVLLS